MSASARSTGYDVVVLGGGVAGCVLAARLSEDPGRTVCLVEAGPDHGPRWREWPSTLLDAHALPRDHLWERRTAVHRFRARVLGGSSCVNGCWNTWGSAADHEEWVRAGGERWSAAALEPYRRRAVEQMRLRPVPEHELSAWSGAALEAARDLGFARVDMGAPGGPGYGTPLLNALDGTRWNAAFAYLGEARSRPNLTVLGDTAAQRLTVRGGRVTAAEVVTAGRRDTLTAGAFLVACGTFGSAALLLRSGVGPADDLRALGIRPEADLPGVGANLTDQPGVFVPLAPTGALNAALAAKEREGDLYVSRMLIRAAGDGCPEGSWNLHVLPSAGDPLFGSLPPGTYEAGISAFLMKPVSRGRVRLRSADPAEAPDIDPGFLSDPGGRDAAALRSGLGIVERLAAAPPLRALADPVPGGPSRESSDAELRARLGTYWHPVGTCAMGRPEDPLAVTDGEGRVRGLANLRVVDASLLPTVPASNTQLPVLAAAEMLADAVKD
ncbi:GMC family oxidoreductase [Streptomyces sp. NPDC051310]|uniref:GMC family oxidoreductase n=1 Tax=Streptomyces sp. NPDC051310 TaxID=3365649 RepID=UPI00378D0D58